MVAGIFCRTVYRNGVFIAYCGPAAIWYRYHRLGRV